MGAALKPVLQADTVLCTDSAGSYAAAGKALGVTVRQIPRGTRKLGPYHIQNVNALHSRLKEGLRPFKGVATQHLPLYLAWFRFFDRRGRAVRPRHFLLDAFDVPENNTD